MEGGVWGSLYRGSLPTADQLSLLRRWRKQTGKGKRKRDAILRSLAVAAELHNAPPWNTPPPGPSPNDRAFNYPILMTTEQRDQANSRLSNGKRTV